MTHFIYPHWLMAGLIGICLVPAAITAQPPLLPDGSAEARKTMAKVKLPDGFKMDLFAAEPLLGNPVAFCLDEQGRVFVAESYRFNRGTEEYRHRPFFLEGDLKNQTVEDRLAMYRHFAGKFPGGMDFFSKYAERVRLLEDRQGTGKADHATTFADGFNDPLDGLAAGVLARDGDIYFTCIPRLWLLRDTKNTGQADVKKVLHHGFGPMTAFLGHDLHGLVFGPDGKLYFSVGDRGYHVKTHEGKILSGPRQGAVFRCDPDGQNLEVIHVGLRNPQELAFDQFGNLFAADNNCDKGDHSRLVYVVEGGHSGWNMAYQTMEAPYLTGPWHAEKLWHLHHPGQPAWIVPPVGKLGAGPGGFTFTSGLGLPARYQNAFFMCNFTGSKGGVDAFRVVPKGAAFDLVDYHPFLTPLLATDVDFGYDGKMYVSDWVEFTWDGGGVGKGRIYTIYDSKTFDIVALRKMAELFRKGFKKIPAQALASLLEHPDQRVRLRAQHELVSSHPLNAQGLFLEAVRKSKNQLARLHGLWGLGQLGRNNPNLVERDLLSFLLDNDTEVRAQAVKLLGDLPKVDSSRLAFLLFTRLKDSSPRVRFFAAQSLGKLRQREAVEPLFALLRTNKDADPYVRHAAVVALDRIGDIEAVLARAKDEEPAMRLGALLVLRRREDPRIARFLEDADELVATEAARAINDIPIPKALPALAQLKIGRLLPDALVRRIINANYRLDEETNARNLTDFVTNAHLSTNLREEALQCLASWDQPGPRDRVIGFWRPLPGRDTSLLARVVEEKMTTLLGSSSGNLQTEVIKLVARLNIKVDEKMFAGWVADPDRHPAARLAALRLLAGLKFANLDQTLQIALKSNLPTLRAAARDLLVDRDQARGLELLEEALAKGAILEKQLAYATLGRLKVSQALDLLANDLEKMLIGKMAPEVQLDLLQAARQVDAPAVKKLLTRYDQSHAKADDLAAFRVALLGGDRERGRDIFLGHTVAQCVRCHKTAGEGGDAGPDLAKLDTLVNREHLLESLLFPDKKITPGYGSVTLVLESGKTLSGVIRAEDAKQLTLLTPDNKTLTIPLQEIEVRTPAKSAMPSMSNVLSLAEMRDVIEFLARLRENN